MKFDNYTITLLSATDINSYFELIENNRKRLEEYFSSTIALTKNIEDTTTHITRIIKKVKTKEYFPFIIKDPLTQKIIAYIDIKNIDWSIPKAEIGYFIDEKYEGKGISTKMLSNIIDYSFNILKINKLLLRIYKNNIGSRKIAEKNGFEIEGTIRKDYKTTNGVLLDLLYYGLINKNNHETLSLKQ